MIRVALGCLLSACVLAGCGSDNKAATATTGTTTANTPGAPIYAGLSRGVATTAAKSTLKRLGRDPASDYYRKSLKLTKITKAEYAGDPAWLARFVDPKSGKPTCLYLWTDLFTNDWRDASFAFQPCP